MGLILRSIAIAALMIWGFPHICPGVSLTDQFFPWGILWAGIFGLVTSFFNLVVMLALQGGMLAGIGSQSLRTFFTSFLGFFVAAIFLPAVNLLLAALLFPAHFIVAGFWWAFWGGLLIGIVNKICTKLLD